MTSSFRRRGHRPPNTPPHPNRLFTMENDQVCAYSHLVAVALNDDRDCAGCPRRPLRPAQMLRDQCVKTPVHLIYNKLTATIADQLITSKDHASIQLSVVDVDAEGKALSTTTTFAICGQVRANGESDDSINRLATKAGCESLFLLCHSGILTVYIPRQYFGVFGRTRSNHIARVFVPSQFMFLLSYKLCEKKELIDCDQTCSQPQPCLIPTRRT